MNWQDYIGRVHQADFRDLTRPLPDACIDTVITDPPYELGFMGKAWDRSGVSFRSETWAELFRVARPGATMLVFGGSRTFHRIAVACEDGGWMLKDTLCWIFGTGFPKSKNFGCKCGGGMVPYSHEGNSEGILSVSDLPEAVSSATQSCQAGEGKLLQSPLRGDSAGPGVGATRPQGSGRLDRRKLRVIPGEDERVEQSSVEGRGDVLAETRQLQADQVRQVPNGIPGDGSQRRVCDGASPPDGADDGSAPPPGGSGTPQESRPAGQPAGESGTVSDEPGAQAGGGVCPKCGGLVDFAGYGTALKPAWEAILVFMKPCDGTFAENALKHGVAGLNVEGCRIDGPAWVRDTGYKQDIRGGSFHAASGKPNVLMPPQHSHPSGRWPANVVLDEQAAEMLDEEVGERPGPGSACDGKAYHGGVVFPGAKRSGPQYPGQTGGPSRFFLRVEADDLCILCLHPATKHGIMSEKQSGGMPCGSANGAGETSSQGERVAGTVAMPVADSGPPPSEGSEGKSSTPASSAESGGETTQATSDGSAPGPAPMPLEELIAPRVKSAGSLCDSCGTAIARSLVLLRQGHDPESLPFPAYISEHRGRILNRVLALYVAGRESTDTILSTESLKMLYGSVKNAIGEATSATEGERAGHGYAPTRFAYHSKASRAEREAGCEALGRDRPDAHNLSSNACGRCGLRVKANGSGRKCECGELRETVKLPRAANHHPTVKPLSLMRWLVRLTATPTGGVVLDPFAGSGSTLIACELEGRPWMGAEMDAEYVGIARARLAWWGERAQMKLLVTEATR